jgi:hypothetical protein
MNLDLETLKKTVAISHKRELSIERDMHSLKKRSD